MGMSHRGLVWVALFGALWACQSEPNDAGGPPADPSSTESREGSERPQDASGALARSWRGASWPRTTPMGRFSPGGLAPRMSGSSAVSSRRRSSPSTRVTPGPTTTLAQVIKFGGSTALSKALSSSSGTGGASPAMRGASGRPCRRIYQG